MLRMSGAESPREVPSRRCGICAAPMDTRAVSNTKDIVAHDLGFARVYVPEKKLRIEETTKARKVSYPIWRAAYDSIVQAEQAVHAAA
jgi:hypothetical protein